ncbi:MAG: ribonuclease D [Flavobacteriales bacterium]
MKDFTYINTQADLEAHLPKLEGVNTLALDLEFDKNRFAYGFNLSLIQLNTGAHILLIDALSISDLSAVFDVFEDEDVEKVVFAFGEDIRLLHTLNCFPKSILDLSIAANLLNYEPCSLSSLSFKVLDVEEKKSSQKSNWLKRPLTDAQLDYAAEDVRHLIPLAEVMQEDIATQNITDWLNEENHKYDLSDFSQTQDFSPLKTKDKKDLSEYQFYMLEQLMQLRESIAKERNSPGYHIVSKDVLLQLAKGEVMIKDLFTVKGVSKYFKTSDAKSSLHDILSSPKQKSQELGFSLTDPAIKRLSKEAYEEMRKNKLKSDKLITNVLMPIKDHIKSAHGDHTASFVFSNKIMNEISKSGLSTQLPYKQKLIWDIAKEKNLDLSELSN